MACCTGCNDGSPCSSGALPFPVDDYTTMDAMGLGTPKLAGPDMPKTPPRYDQVWTLLDAGVTTSDLKDMDPRVPIRPMVSYPI
jgi:hypothetical protein